MWAANIAHLSAPARRDARAAHSRARSTTSAAGQGPPAGAVVSWVLQLAPGRSVAPLVVVSSRFISVRLTAARLARIWCRGRPLPRGLLMRAHLPSFRLPLLRLPQRGVAALAVGVALGVGTRGGCAQTFRGVEYLVGVSGVRGPLRGQLVVTPDSVAFRGEDGTTAFALPRRVVDLVTARDSVAFGSVLALQLPQGDPPGNVVFKVTSSVAADIGAASSPRPPPPS